MGSIFRMENIYTKIDELLFIPLHYYILMRSRNKPEYQEKIAEERIDILFKEAASAEPELGKRYVRLAKKIGMRYNIRLGRLKRKFCRHCYSFFTAKNSKIRIKNGTINIKCLSCNNVKRITCKKS